MTDSDPWEAEIERLELEVAAWKQASDLKSTEIGRLRKELADRKKLFNLVDGMWRDAEAEVEQMEAEIARLEKDLRDVRAWARQDINRLTAEIERLRAVYEGA